MARRKEDRPRQPRKSGWRDTPDEFWGVVEPLLPKGHKRTSRGRPRADPRKVFDGIVYVLRTGIQWKMMPREYPSGSTCHRYFQRWERKRVFRKLWANCLVEYDEAVGVQWKWQAADSVSVQAPVKGGI